MAGAVAVAGQQVAGTGCTAAAGAVTGQAVAAGQRQVQWRPVTSSSVRPTSSLGATAEVGHRAAVVQVRVRPVRSVPPVRHTQQQQQLPTTNTSLRHTLPQTQVRTKDFKKHFDVIFFIKGQNFNTFRGKFNFCARKSISFNP